MDKQTKKQMVAEYMQRKPDMGVFMIRSKSENKCHVEAAKDFRSKMNGSLVKLEAGSHPNLELQQDWTARGKEQFDMCILEKLEPKKEEENKDYTQDLNLLKELWMEKLLEEEGMYFYSRRLPRP